MAQGKLADLVPLCVLQAYQCLAIARELQTQRDEAGLADDDLAERFCQLPGKLQARHEQLWRTHLEQGVTTGAGPTSDMVSPPDEFLISGEAAGFFSGARVSTRTLSSELSES